MNIKLTVLVFLMTSMTLYAFKKESRLTTRHYFEKINQINEIIDSNIYNNWKLTKLKIRNGDWNEAVNSSCYKQIVLMSTNTYVIFNDLQYNSGKWNLNGNFIGFYQTEINGKLNESTSYSYLFEIIELSEKHLILKIQSREGYIYYYYESMYRGKY